MIASAEAQIAIRKNKDTLQVTDVGQACERRHVVGGGCSVNGVARETVDALQHPPARQQGRIEVHRPQKRIDRPRAASLRATKQRPRSWCSRLNRGLDRFRGDRAPPRAPSMRPRLRELIAAATLGQDIAIDGQVLDLAPRISRQGRRVPGHLAASPSDLPISHVLPAAERSMPAIVASMRQGPAPAAARRLRSIFRLAVARRSELGPPSRPNTRGLGEHFGFDELGRGRERTGLGGAEVRASRFQPTTGRWRCRSRRRRSRRPTADAADMQRCRIATRRRR